MKTMAEWKEWYYEDVDLNALIVGVREEQEGKDENLDRDD